MFLTKEKAIFFSCSLEPKSKLSNKTFAQGRKLGCKIYQKKHNTAVVLLLLPFPILSCGEKPWNCESKVDTQHQFFSFFFFLSRKWVHFLSCPRDNCECCNGTRVSYSLLHSLFPLVNSNRSQYKTSVAVVIVVVDREIYVRCAYEFHNLWTEQPG